MSLWPPDWVPPAQRATEVAETYLHELERPVLRAVNGRLFGESIYLSDPDLEAAYNRAWHGVCQMVAKGEEVENLTGLLITITRMRAIDTYRQRHETRLVDATLEDHAKELDFAKQIDDRHMIYRLNRGLARRLNSKERNAVTLCLLHGYRRCEAAERLGIPEPAFQKIIDRAMRKVATVVAAIRARGCGGDEWARTLRGFALGRLSKDNPDYARVVRHIEECESCRRYVTGIGDGGASSAK